jgi:hypothetical protein
MRCFSSEQRDAARKNPKKFIPSLRQEVTADMCECGNPREQEVFAKLLDTLLPVSITSDPELSHSLDILEMALDLWALGKIQAEEETTEYFRKRMHDTNKRFNPIYDVLFRRARNIYDFRNDRRWQRLDKSIKSVAYTKALEMANDTLKPEQRKELEGVELAELADAFVKWRKRDMKRKRKQTEKKGRRVPRT